MLERPIRQAATRLLDVAIRIAPPDIRDWGRAMQNELPYVESGWAALLWALGGAVVLGKRALVRAVRGTVLDGGLFARSVSLRKVALLASGVYVLGALLFFAAPPFRQALRVSLTPWAALLHPAGEHGQAQVEAIGKRAEARHDPDGMIFAAARLSNPRESARLVARAVQMNPRLIWAYAVVAVRHPEASEVRQWIPALVRWQPHNALFPLIAAASIRLDDAAAPAEGRRQRTPGAEWRQAMASAFAAPKFDDYLDRLQALDRRVVRRYGFNNPQALLAGERGGLPADTSLGVWRYATSVLNAGDRFDARGNWKSAEASYWSVARFGQVMDSQALGDHERWVGTTLQWMAYQRLEKVAARQGNSNEAALFAYLGKKFDPATGVTAVALRKSVFGDYIARRNAFVLQFSALMMLMFSLLLISAAVILIVTSRAPGRSGRKKGGAAIFLALTSAVGLLLSSATVYLTYRPYWYILQNDLLKGSASQNSGLRSFMAAIRKVPGPDSRMVLSLPLYFWASVILAAVALLTFIFLRHFREPPRLTEPQANSRVQ